MIQYLKKVVLFITIFIFINIIYLAILFHYNPDFSKRIESLKLNHEKLDIAIFGNSYALDDFDVEIIEKQGMSGYNFALGGASVKTTYTQLIELQKNLNGKLPKYIVYGLGPSLDQSDKIHPIVTWTKFNRPWSLNDLPVYKFNWLIYELIKILISEDHRKSYIHKGQFRSPKKVPDYTTLDSAASLLENLCADTFFKEIIHLCSARKSTLIIVELPAVKNKRNFSTPHTFTFITRSNYYTYFNLNTPVNTSWINEQEDWLGGSHLNQYGAEKFTKQFMDTLIARRKSR